MARELNHGQARGKQQRPQMGRRALRWSSTGLLMPLIGSVVGPLDWSSPAGAEAPQGGAPALWSGTLRSAKGSPVSGTVVAFLRPAPGAVPDRPKGVADEDIVGLPPIVLAEVAVDESGYFDLRASLPKEVPSAYVQDGIYNVMLFASSADGKWAVATDSLWYLDEAEVAPAWFTSPESFLSARSLARSGGRSEEIAAIETKDRAGAVDRPTDLVLTEPSPEGFQAQRSQLVAAAVPPGGSYRGCTALYVDSRASTFKSVDQIDIAPNWQAVAEYSQTQSTSWQVGYSASGSSGWAIAGSATFSSSHGEGVGYSIASGGSFKQDTWQMRIGHDKVRWRCGDVSSPGPFYVYTAEPTSTDWQTRNTGAGPNLGCNANFKHSVAGNSFYWRDSGTSATYDGSSSVFGFTGKATVNYGSYSRHRWDNQVGVTRNLCGETGSVRTGRSRVSAEA